jgi:glycosyltransferase involved in cell wall biosynthesis
MQTVSIGIPSYNEANNLGLLLDRIFSDNDNTTFRIIEIIISDDSTDGTPDIVQQYLKTNHECKIRFFHHDHRRGAANAWNEIMSNANGNVIVMYDADVIPEKNCTSQLVSVIGDKYGLCASNPQPLSGDGIPGRASIFIARWLESIRIKQFSQYTVMGRGVALQNHIAKKVKIPPHVIAIDLFLQDAVFDLGYRVTYNPKAIVLFKPASTFEDFSSQILRANRGHSQLMGLHGKVKHKLELKTAFMEGIQNIVKDPFGAASLALSSLVLPYYILKIKNFNSAMWHTARSTKNIPQDIPL